jgi:hypothetical protein
VFFAGFLSACVMWVAVVASVVGVAQRRVSTRFLRAANLFAAVVLAAFAALLAARLLGGLA